MQSVIQEKSYNSVRVFWLNKDILWENLRQCVKTLSTQRQEIQKVIVFGSVAVGRETVRSDVDILILVSGTNERFIDRALHYRSFFDEVGLDVDIFVYTADEFKKSAFYETAGKTGVVLFKK